MYLVDEAPLDPEELLSLDDHHHELHALIAQLRSELDELRGKFTELESGLAEAERVQRSLVDFIIGCGEDGEGVLTEILARANSKKEKEEK